MGIYVKAEDFNEGRVISHGRDNWVYCKRTRAWEWKRKKGWRKENGPAGVNPFQKVLLPAPSAAKDRTSGEGLVGWEFSAWLRGVRKGEYPCHYCGGRASTVDHKTPRSQGGWTVPGNVVSACGACNTFRGCLPYEEFKAFGWKRRRFI